jgi:hypothetical protein
MDNTLRFRHVLKSILSTAATDHGLSELTEMLSQLTVQTTLVVSSAGTMGAIKWVKPIRFHIAFARLNPLASTLDTVHEHNLGGVLGYCRIVVE